MKSAIFAAIAVVMFVSSPSVQSDKSVAGKWDLSADTPHGVMTMGLDLQQTGTVIAGKLIGFMSKDFDLKGEFKNGQLTMTTSDEQMSFSASLKADGTLAGHLSTPQGDVTWKAARPKKS
jgi:hypothetical protein